MPARFPGGGCFAFTILDDTDDATLENVKPIYDLLLELGFRTTKTAWPLSCTLEEQGIYFAGSTLQEPAYLSWVQELVGNGFELASHNATMASSDRQRTAAGLDFLATHFTQPVRLHCNHGQNRENLYWGRARYRHPVFQTVSRLTSRLTTPELFEGEEETSRYFWGDLALARFDYVRSFAFRTLNLDKVPVSSPYADPSTKWVRKWFVTADAPDVRSFNRLVTKDSLDRLHRSRGYSIVSTHLGKGFVRSGRVDPQVEDTLRYAASLPGWFPSVSDLLDFRIEHEDAGKPLAFSQRLLLETRHVLDRLSDRLSR